MSRTILGRGSFGSLVTTLQKGLKPLGFYTGRIDGDFGGGTERAVRAFQREHEREETGRVDAEVWTELTGAEVPSLFARCLQLTARFEGHGFGMAYGNWDGAWLTWGIIGFTLKHGGVRDIVLEVEARSPETLRASFGPLTDEVLGVMRGTGTSANRRRRDWANSISLGSSRYRIAEQWRAAFLDFGAQPLVQAIQLGMAREQYFEPARATRVRHRLETELGMALCFDIHVQNGGIGKTARSRIEAGRKDLEGERALRMLIANAVADSAKKAFREDVRSRKLCAATGSGAVHGAQFLLDSWGLGEHTDE